MHRRAAVILLVLPLAAACSRGKHYDTPDQAPGGTGGAVSTKDPTLVKPSKGTPSVAKPSGRLASYPNVAGLASKAGCGKVTFMKPPRPGAAQSGICDIKLGSLTLSTFASPAKRQAYITGELAYFPHSIYGDNWVIDSYLGDADKQKLAATLGGVES